MIVLILLQKNNYLVQELKLPRSSPHHKAGYRPWTSYQLLSLPSFSIFSPQTFHFKLLSLIFAALVYRHWALRHKMKKRLHHAGSSLFFSRTKCHKNGTCWGKNKCCCFADEQLFWCESVHLLDSHLRVGWVRWQTHNNKLGHNV